MNDDIKLGYSIACNRLNEDIDIMIDELHDAYMRQIDGRLRDRLDAQIKILWSFKNRIEDCVAESIGRAEAIKECVNKYTEMLIDEYHLRTYLQIASIKRLEQKVLAKMAGGEMREILYRGKVKETGEWVEGFYIKQRDSLLEGIVHHYIAVHEKNKRGLLNPMLTWYIVIPKTVGQYTGLTDKNGEKIFEGDIVEGLDYDEEDGYGVVTWDDGAFWVGNNHYSGTFCDNYYGCDFEIIGNIHDNFEFIKGGVEG